jgi:uridylate kinase
MRAIHWNRSPLEARPVPSSGAGRIPFFQNHQREGIMEAVNTDMHSEKSKRRVLLKLSGEVFGGGKLGVDPETVRDVAKQIAAAVPQVEVAIVVGGGNFFRGAELSQSGMDRSRADYMGMLGTVMNCLALQDFLEQAGVETRVQSAITMGQVAEAYIPRRAIRHMEKGRVVIFGAGAGLPYFSTDTVAAQRALEVHADVVLMGKSGVDAVYTADPKKDPNAERLETLSYDDALRRDIRVMDQTAMTMCKDNDLSMVVFGMEGEGNVTRAILGEKLGTLVTT